MKRALVYASVASMIQQFNMDHIRLLLEKGYEVDIACNMEQGSSISREKIREMQTQLEQMSCRIYHVPVPRKLTAIGAMWKSFRRSRQIMNERHYDLIHCHSPIGGMICRLANRVSEGYGRTKMIYTAHGFHFFRGAPVKNWLLFYPVEKFCSRFTDVLITINREDHDLAERKMKAGQVLYVPGVGIDPEKAEKAPGIRRELCAQLGLDEPSLLMLSVGELNDNKNHRAVVEALPNLPGNIHYLICGQGQRASVLEELAKQNGCESRLHLLGYRSDVLSVMRSCDLFVFPSKREGLSVALMEAMACGLPCLAGDIRGNRDLLDAYALLPVEHFTQQLCPAVNAISQRTGCWQQCGERNKEKIRHFSREVVREMMEKIYV